MCLKGSERTKRSRAISLEPKVCWLVCEHEPKQPKKLRDGLVVKENLGDELKVLWFDTKLLQINKAELTQVLAVEAMDRAE
jgi:hypothetical protein